MDAEVVGREVGGFNGKRLTELREAAKLSRAELAQRAGISRSHVIKIECGERKPTYDVAAKLAEALGCGLDAFMREAA